MDPSIMKFLEEDEDETMHSGADVEAFTAALNRDIEGDTNNNNDNVTESQQPSTSSTNTAVANATSSSGVDTVATTAANASLAQATNHTPSELFQQWQSSTREEEVKPQTQEPVAGVNRIGPSGSETQHPQNQTSREPTRPKEEQANQHNTHASQAMNTQSTSDRNPAQNAARNPDMHRVSSNQQAAQAANRPAGKQVPFAMLLPVIEPQLDRDRAAQLQTLYARLRSNSINKEEFVRHMRTLVGDHMLKMAVFRLQQGQVPAPARQNTQRASSSLQSSDASALPADQRPRLLERHTDSHGGQASHASNANQSHDLQMRQGQVNPAMATQAMSQHALNDMKRLHGGGHAHFTGNPALQQNSSHWQASMHKDQGLMSSNPYAKSDSADQMNDQQHRSQLSAPHGLEHATRGPGSSKDDTFEAMASRPANSSLASGGNAKTPPKKPIVGQKKPLEAPVNPLSKKQKVVGAFADQSIEQLNDVTAVSGVNLREEEEQLFSGAKEDSRVSEASRKVVQEEEERLILQKNPLQKKLAEIMAKCGVKTVSNDLERCLSLCVEERLRGLISNLIRISKQRVDLERPRHRTVITSDVRKQIMSMNQKAREEWEKKQADVEKLQRADEVNKEEDDKMRTTAANVAARAAVGGDDMLSKWQLMAEQARQKREGGADSASTSQPSVDVGPKPVSTSERTLNDNQDTEKTSAPATVTVTPGPVRKSLRNQVVPQNVSVPRTISIKDVISVLGRETQMSRSTLIYRLYEKMRSDSVPE
ncbi:Histone-fold [Artemisia annua]|uniref:Histone-fold n=1 Tax=Artemisia annua TaxID=35608 RepID=A0A2U1MC70_ARTAN|nr:Histone-fold [Artemisia annua]